MSERKHTQGPWLATCNLPDCWDDKNVEPQIWEKASGLTIVDYAYSDFDQETTCANVCLISAAPDLLDELEEAVDIIRFFHGQAGWAEYQSSPEMQRIKAAIAKARGEL